MSRPFSPRIVSSLVRINGKIRAREVRVIADDGQQLGILPLSDAIRLAQNKGVDLVEIAPNATPPVCRLVDYGKFRYEQAKRDKEARKHQHANKLKEIQLSANIDPHDFSVKLGHAVDFLCEEMKVKVSLRFRGREMAHTEFGFQVVEKFVNELAAFGHPDAPPKLVGRNINIMFSPLPRNKRGKSPRQASEAGQVSLAVMPPVGVRSATPPREKPAVAAEADRSTGQDRNSDDGFVNSPFAGLDLKVNE